MGREHEQAYGEGVKKAKRVKAGKEGSEWLEDFYDEVLPVPKASEYLSRRQGYKDEMARPTTEEEDCSDDSDERYLSGESTYGESDSSDYGSSTTHCTRRPITVRELWKGLEAFLFYLIPMLFVGLNWQDYGVGPKNAWIFGVLWPFFGGLGGLTWGLYKLIGRDYRSFGTYVFFNAVKGLIVALLIWGVFFLVKRVISRADS